jgi:adenosylmethionine-8-amino-7-oxononanoate aminotransferase
MKLARQYFLELSQPQATRTKFIAREGSWHGCTLGALAVGDFKVRKHLFEPLLPANVTRVSACNPYRGLRDGEGTEDYVARLAAELDAEFVKLGPETVCAFIAEPIVGTVRINPTMGLFTGKPRPRSIGVNRLSRLWVASRLFLATSKL